ncbi:FAD/NAD(P)-binding protein [Streptomyces sp. ME02-8801-2C]|uniref:FAD/NAD(P)-binding protein n=1 Tax=Streptomyces sp. ME02-8801-2C TaxID=3028680 RepID=UPI0029A5A9A7|nr:FAD/NAD(P)-binding protein [Streptomyces sp. ME02-8801-2C]MDX3451640.1 FAD/NAD(P)-binding protein [Streptomyces sp. ME02-8801-2C]
MPSGDLCLCLVGAGPRGLSVLERLCANERSAPAHRAVTVHVVDPYSPGAGRVWRTGQSRVLLMNTVASQVTVFTDASVEMDGPVEPGPSLYAWARTLGDGPGEAALYDEAVLAEARRLGPDDYPSRAFYGRYLEDVFVRLVSGAPPHVRVRVHRARAVALRERPEDGAQQVVLSDGEILDGLDAVVLSQGHVPTDVSSAQRQLSRRARAHGLLHVLPANPADLDLSDVRSGETVLLRGLGLNFFDHMALLTVGRGGRFDRVGERLVYRPSGREPRIVAGSRRGIPYHARGANEKGAHGRHEPRLLTEKVVAALRERAVDGERVYFGTDLWPLIAREVESVYYAALLTARGREAEREEFVERFVALPEGPVHTGELLDTYRIAHDERWDWDRIFRPHGDGEFADRAEFRRWMLEHLRQDVREARAGNVSGPLKAALDVLRDLRNEVRLALDHGGLDGNSYRDEVEGWYTPLNAFLSIGPPFSRIEELIALLEAGVLDLIGPGLRVRVDGTAGAFVAESDAVGGAPVRARVLVEARLPEPDLRRTSDPLLRAMLSTGQCRPFRIPGACGTSYETGGLEVTERPYHLVDAYGRGHPRRFAYGVPTEAVHWVTAAGIRPGVNSVTLGDSDAIARAVLALAPARAGASRRRSGRTLTEAPA